MSKNEKVAPTPLPSDLRPTITARWAYPTLVHQNDRKGCKRDYLHICPGITFFSVLERPGKTLRGGTSPWLDEGYGNQSSEPINIIMVDMMNSGHVLSHQKWKTQGSKKLKC